MRRIQSIIFSPALAVVLLLIFAIAMASATFIENDFGIQTARTMVYNAWWFEMVMILLGMSFAGNIYKYRLFRKEKFPILLFHIAFIVILLGAGITRYTAYEGIMRIREGASSNAIISDRNFLQLQIQQEGDSLNYKKEIYFTPIKNNDFSVNQKFQEKEIGVNYKDFIPDAQLQVVADTLAGEPILEIVVANENAKETIFLKKGDVRQFGAHQHQLTFDNEIENAINILEVNGKLMVKSAMTVDFFIMETQEAGKLKIDSLDVFNMSTLYRSHDFSFVPASYHPKGKLKWRSAAKKPKDNNEVLDDILLLDVSIDNTSKEIALIYKHGYLPQFVHENFNGIDMSLAYGAIPLKTPFSIKLNDFQLERYPGSSSPSAYASEITVIDKEENMDYRIFMNNVLDYKGYRFFQASYDTDEKGTVLAINHDRIGTLVTYLGYILMGLGMLLTLFGKGSRFTTVLLKLKKINANKALGLFMMVFLLTNAPINAQTTQSALDSLIADQLIDKHHAALFGRLMVQDLDGRIKPVNTLASEFLRKISRKSYYQYDKGRLDANQTYLAIHMNPSAWSKIPLIKIDRKKGGDIFKDIHTNENDLAAFNEFIKADDAYILEKYVEEANEKKPAERSEFDKEVLNVDERFNILYHVLSGADLKIFPKRADENKKWFSYTHHFQDFEEEDADFAKGIIPVYFFDILEAKKSGNWQNAEDKLAYIKKYQNVLAPEIIPAPQQVEAELWYNRLNLNFWLFQAYFVLGIALLTLAIVKIFTVKKSLNILSNFLVVATLIAFLIHGGNLILRWYVSGHAPWSNGYEMIVFVAWSLMLFGILFYKKSDFVLPLASIFTGTLLFVSYLDWLSPEITNLMPVLKSYWLKIHVAVIIGSYAPLALSALLGFMALILMIFKTDSNKYQMNIRIKELTYINELSMTIGLFLLAIGTFLGGVWANESWGRYWAWDPKETWALISIIVYATVLHFRLIPNLKNDYVLNLASVIAFFSIVMTSFGVNYYLTGLHSYATGDPVPIPNFIYVSIGVIVLVGIGAYLKFYKKVKTIK